MFSFWRVFAFVFLPFIAFARFPRVALGSKKVLNARKERTDLNSWVDALSASGPNRVCKGCDFVFEIHPLMHEGQGLQCDCGALGTLSRFPCPKPGCDCPGFLSVEWIPETFLEFPDL